MTDKVAIVGGKPISNNIYNLENTSWETGDYPLFLGEAPAFHDSINRPYPEIFSKYKLQKSIDWSESEVGLEQSRLDLMRCSSNTFDIMVNNLIFQLELDSIASRGIVPLFAPFISNNELWAAYSKIGEIEVLHSLTYSEIIRQCVPDPIAVLKRIMHHQQAIDRASKVVEVFENLQQVGAKVTLGLIERDCMETRRAVLLGVIALYLLERVEFMSSFASTFIMGEQQIMIGICKLVQKIAQDEQVHYKLGEDVIRILYKTGWLPYVHLFAEEIMEIFTEIGNQELAWNKYLFSEGRSIVGLNRDLLDEWAMYNITGASRIIQLDNPFDEITKNPLPWMDEWIKIDLVQNANQETENTNYPMNSVVDDLGDEELDLDL